MTRFNKRPPIQKRYTTGLEGQVSRSDLVGSKARNLARLAELGLPVPPAFCLTTEAYGAFVEVNAIGRVIESSLAEVDCCDPAGVRLAAREIRRTFLAGVFPPELATEIEESHRRLGGCVAAGCRVAVRSSSTVEDGANASHAGGLVSVLNVGSLPSLFDALRDCWASLWTERAVAYRHRLGMDESGAAMALIVQQMVDADVSAVLFTADPVTGNRQCLVLEACRGLGEMLVSGKVTPEHYEIDRATGRIQSQRPGRQNEMLVVRGGELRVEPMPEEPRGRSCLLPEQVQRLAILAREIEEHFGGPQEIEWAIRADSSGALTQFYVLQTRPITALPQKGRTAVSFGVRWESPVPGANWLRDYGGMAEYLPGPPSPLYATAQLPLLCRRLDAHSVSLGIRRMEPTQTFINGFLYFRRDWRMTASTLLFPLRFWMGARRRAWWWREQALPAHTEELEALSSFDLSGASCELLLEHLKRLLSFNAAAWETAVRVSMTWVFTEPQFRRLFDRLIRPITRGSAVVFLRGFESQTMAGEAAQWALLRAVESSPELSDCLRRHSPRQTMAQLARRPSCRQWFQDFLDYCRRYGHAGARLDFLYPTAADDPARAMEDLQIRMDLPACDPVERQRRLIAERESATREAVEGLSGFRFRKALFCWALRWAQQGAAIREDVFFHALRGAPLARQTVLTLGRRLWERGALADPEDIFFLTWEELQEAVLSREAGDWRAAIAQRRRDRHLRTRLTPPPCVPLEGPPETLGRHFMLGLRRLLLGAGCQSENGVLRGAPVSPGTATGPARVIHSPAEFDRLRNGDILVTHTATPEWMILFPLAAGLVTDTGGPLSHSSIVAREFGLPAVMGVQRATLEIADGQLVTVDGNEGLVCLH